MNHQSTFVVTFLVRRTRANTSGEIPIYIRIIVDSKPVEVATKHYVKPDQWSPEKGRVKGNTEYARTLNAFLDNSKTKLTKIFNRLEEQEELITAERIKNIFVGKAGKQRTLLEVFDYHNNQMKAQVGKDYALGTYKRFEIAKKLVQEFMQYQYAKSDVFLSELDYEFVTNLEFYFKTVRKCAHNTTMKYITNLRKIVYMARLHGWLEQDPFMKFKCTIKETKRHYLTEEEITLLQEKEIDIDRLAQVRDIFLFCCYTGLAYADVHKLTPNQIGRGVDGKYWIFTDRTKTKTASHIPLLSPALALVEKYKDHPEAVNRSRIFPVSSNQKMNAYLKEIADLCGISKTLTTHVARHTFATTVTLTNGVPLETVSSMLGHKSIKTTQHYAKVVQKKVGQDMEQLEQQLASKRQTSPQKKSRSSMQ